MASVSLGTRKMINLASSKARCTYLLLVSSSNQTGYLLSLFFYENVSELDSSDSGLGLEALQKEDEALPILFIKNETSVMEQKTNSILRD